MFYAERRRGSSREVRSRIAIAIIAKEVLDWIKGWLLSFWKSGSLVPSAVPREFVASMTLRADGEDEREGREAETEGETR